GQKSDTSFIKNNKINTGRGGVILADPRTLATEQQGVFAGGDVVTGPQTVIEAIAAGQRAACSIKRYLQGEELLPRMERDDQEVIPVTQIFPTDEELQQKARFESSHIPITDRVSSFKEVAMSYDADIAKKESARCLRCDLEV
ncbi:MAG: hypothetical protein J7L90_04415, partial [Dehalococcoidia bacterium]|nr:hypothetical protein [Dehalococcoidia bacterium]